MARRQTVTSERLTEALQLVAPGTQIRDALDNILRARTGALVVFAEEEIDGYLVYRRVPPVQNVWLSDSVRNPSDPRDLLCRMRQQLAGPAAGSRTSV